MASRLKLPYGLRDTEMVHISQVENGLACGCTCPGCGAPLVARNAAKNVKVAHFAHHKTVECSSGLQTALHLAAKDIIARRRELCLPGASGYFPLTEAFWNSFSFDARPYESYLYDYFGGYYDEDEDASYYEPEDLSRYYFQPQRVTIDTVILEKKTGDIIPDILVSVGGRQLLVEVAVTHFVDAEKRGKIKALGLAAIEIDLSKCPRDLTVEALEELIIEGVAQKTWLNNPTLRAKLSQRRQAYFAACRPHLERVHAERQQEAARRAAREKWKADLAAKPPEERVRIEQNKQEFYRKNYRPITERGVGQTLEPVLHVDGCPKGARRFHDKPYANVEFDCRNCQAFRGYSPNRSAVVCLFDYLKRKENHS